MMINVKTKIKKFIEEDDKSTAKAALYYMICQLLVRGMAFLTTPIFSRIMNKAEYGMVSNILAWEAVLYPLLTLNLRVTINKSRYDYDNDNDSYLASILTISGFVVFVVYLIAEINQGIATHLLGMEMKYIRILFLYIIFYVAFDYQQIQYNIFLKYRLYVIYSIASSLFSLGLSVVLVCFLDDKPLGRMLGIVVPTALIGTIIYRNAYKRCIRIKKEYFKYAIVMAIPLIPSALSATVLSSSDKIIITKYCGDDQTAMYAIPYTIASIAAILWTALNQAWGPWLYDNLNKKEYKRIRDVSKKFVVVYSILVVGLMLIAPEMLYILGGKQYLAAINAMPPVVLAMVFQFFYAFYFDVEYFYGETYVISLGTLLAAIINIILNIVFVPRFGYVAASYTTLVCYVLMMVYHFMIVKYKLKKAYIYDTKFFIMFIVSLVLIQSGLVFLYELNLIRYIVIAMYALIIICLIKKNKEIVIGFLSKFKKKG